MAAVLDTNTCMQVYLFVIYIEFVYVCILNITATNVCTESVFFGTSISSFFLDINKKFPS